MNRKQKRKKYRRKRLCKGSISVLLSIILIPCLTFTALMVDYANIMMSKAVVESTGELVTNAALANYDTVLEEVYGLFAVSQNEEELTANLEKYFKNTLSANGIMPQQSEFSSEILNGIQQDLNDYFGTVTADDINRNFLQIEYDNFSAQGVSGSELSNPDILKNQIVEFMKYRGPAEVGLDLLSSLNAFKLANDKTEVAEKKMDVDEKINELGETSKEFYNALVEYDKLMEEFKKAEEEFQGSVDDLNQKMRDVNDNLAFLYEVPVLPELLYVQYNDAKDEYTMVWWTYGENDYETLLEEIQKKMIQMQDNEKILEENKNKISSFKLKDKVEIYPKFAEYMGMLEVLDMMALKLKEFDSSNYNLEKKPGESQAEYDARVAAEPINQQQVLDSIQEVLENAYSKLQGTPTSGYRKGYEDFKKERESRYEKVSEIMSEVTSKVQAYYNAANQLITSTRDKSGWEHLEFWSDGETFFDYAIRLGEEVKSDMQEVQTANNAFDSALTTYKNKQSKDEYYGSMKSEVEQNKETFTSEHVDEILVQLRAGRNYVNGENGVIKTIQSWTFYEENIWDGSVDNVEKAYDAAWYIFNALGEEFDYKNEYQYYETYFPIKFSTNRNNYHKDFFPKQIREANVVVDGETYNVPAYYLYLVSTYGVEERDDTGENLENTAKNINDEAIENAAEKETDNTYSASVFDVLQTNNGTDATSSDFPEIEDGNTGILKQFKNLSKTARNIFGALTGGLENARDNLLVTEYLFENFSYATYDKQENFDAAKPEFKTMTMQNINKNNNTIYGCEIEYILKGYRGGTSGWWIFSSESGPEDNIAMVKADIFTIRFVMNSIFALTDGSLDAQTLAPALSIQAATGGLFPYQVAQVVLKLCLALAESTWDIQQLMDGEKVPLMKTSATWQFSVNGMVNMIKEKAVEEITEVIDGKINDLSNYLQQCVSNTGSWVEEKEAEITNSVTEEIKSVTESALDEALSSMTQIATDQIQISYTNIFAEGNGYSPEILKNELSTALKDYISSAGFSSEVTTFLNGQVDTVVSYMIDNKGEKGDKLSVSELLQQCSQEFSQSGNGEIVLNSNMYSQLLDKAADSVEQYKIFISEKTTIFKDAVDNMTSEVVGEVTTQVNQLIRDKSEAAAQKIEETVSNYLNKNFPTSTAVTVGGKNQGSSSKLANVFSFSYEDYLKLFIFLELSGEGEAGIMRRIADVIELNVDSGLKDYYAQTGISQVQGFSMSKAYTYVEVQAEVHVIPLLLSQDIFMKGTGEKRKINFWSYQYENIAGY